MTRSLPALLLLCLTAWTARGATPPPGPGGSGGSGGIPVVTQVVPQEALGVDPRPVLLEEAEFERLVRSLGEPRLPSRVGLSPARVVLTLPPPTSGTEQEGVGLPLTLERSAWIQGQGPVAVPLGPEGIALRRLRVRRPGEEWSRATPRRPAGGAVVWLAPEPGAWELEVELELGPDSSGGYHLPPWPGSAGSVALSGEGGIVLLPGDREVTSGTLVLPTEDGLRFRLQGPGAPSSPGPRSPAANPEPGQSSPRKVPPPTARWEVLATLLADQVEIQAEVELTQPGLGRSNLTLRLPPEARIQLVRGEQVASWNSQLVEEELELRLQLRRALQGRSRLELRYQLPLGSQAASCRIALPRLPRALRERALLAVAPGDVLEISPEAATLEVLTPLPLEEIPPALTARARTPVLAGFRSSGPGASLTLPLRSLEAPRHPRLAVQAINGLTVAARGKNARGEERLSMVSKLVLHLQNTGERTLDLELPEGAEVLGCAVARRPTPPLRDPDSPGRLRVPLPRSRILPTGLEVIPVQLSYRHDQPGSPLGRSELGIPLPVIHAPVGETTWKVYTPEELRVLGARGPLRWSNRESPFAPELVTRLFFEEVVEPLLQSLAFLLLLATLLAAARSPSLRDLGGKLLEVLWSRVFQLLGLLFVLSILSAIAVPNFQAARRRSNVRACFANQKTLAGAIEMYNLDFNTDFQGDLDDLLPELVQNGYLQSEPRDPGGRGRYFLDPESGNGIACTVHGSIHGGGARRGQPAPLKSLPQGRRTAPVDVSIPSRGEELLFERGFLRRGRTLEMTLEVLDSRRREVRRGLGFLVGMALALVAAVWLRSGVASELTLGGGLLAGVLLLDPLEASLAGAFLIGAAGTLAVLAGGRLLVTLPDRVRSLLALLRGVTLLGLVLLPLGARAGDLGPVELLEIPGRSWQGRVLVDAASYQRLTRRAPSALPTLSPVTHASILLEAAEDGILAEYTLEVAPTEEWFRLLPRPRESQLVEARHGERAWPLESSEKAWRSPPLPRGGTLHLRLLLPRIRNARGLRAVLPTPESATATLEVRPLEGTRTLVAGRPHRGSRSLVASGQQIPVQWEKQVREARRTPVAQQSELRAQASYLVELGPGDARVEGYLDLSLEGGARQEFRLRLPPGWTALELRAPELADWEQRGEELLVISFRKPWRGERALRWTAEIRGLGAEALSLAFPRLQDCRGEVRRVALTSTSDRLLELSPGRDLREPRDHAWPFRPDLMIRAQARLELPREGQPRITGRLRKLEAVVLQQARVDVARYQGSLTEDGHLLLEARLQVKNATRQFLRVRLPKGAQLYATRVAGRSVRAAASGDGAVLLPLARSAVVDGGLAPFPVEWVVGFPVEGNPLEAMTLTLPELDLPVGSLRAALGVPPGQRLEVSSSGARTTREEVPVSFPEIEAVQSSPSMELPLEVGESPLHLSRDWLRPEDGAVEVRGRLVPEQGKRGRRLGHFAAGFLGIWVLLVLLRAYSRTGLLLAALGALLVVAAAVMTSRSSPGPELLLVVGAFDAWVLRVLLVAWRSPGPGPLPRGEEAA